LQRNYTIFEPNPTLLLRFRRPFDVVALRVAYAPPVAGHHRIVENGVLSRVFAGSKKMLTQLSND
jgi:hypothetical protein